MKFEYSALEMEVVELETCDVISDSPTKPSGGDGQIDDDV